MSKDHDSQGAEIAKYLDDKVLANGGEIKAGESYPIHENATVTYMGVDLASKPDESVMVSLNAATMTFTPINPEGANWLKALQDAPEGSDEWKRLAYGDWSQLATHKGGSNEQD